MTSFIVMPWVYKPYRDACLATLDRGVFEVDNSKNNIGVAESWNKGIDNMGDADWLIIMSASVRFEGNAECLNHLEQHPEARMVYFVDEYPSWRLVALHKDVIKDVGRFDKTFFPAYFEDVDYELRASRAGYRWTTMPAKYTVASEGHGIALGGIKPRTEELINYFATKWGRHPAAKELPAYKYPFNKEPRHV